MKKGIFGGTFDPIHNTHLNMALMACDKLCLDRVIFMPNSTPPHKPQAVADAYQRYEMIRLAIEGNQKLEVSDYELKKEGYSYTVDTIHQLQKSEPDSEFVFIMGADSLSYIEHWWQGCTLLGLCEFAVFARGGYELNIRTKITELKDKHEAVIYEIPVIESEISSAMIRKKLQENQNIDGLVPSKVADYIYRNNIYQKINVRE